MITEVFDEWLDSIVQQGTYYIASLVKVYDNVITMTKELDLEAIAWEKERTK